MIRIHNGRRIMVTWPLATFGRLSRRADGSTYRNDSTRRPAGYVIGVAGFYLIVEAAR
jgi:hypothetical protein